jgi:hypothetical protein
MEARPLLRPVDSYAQASTTAPVSSSAGRHAQQRAAHRECRSCLRQSEGRGWRSPSAPGRRCVIATWLPASASVQVQGRTALSPALSPARHRREGKLFRGAALQRARKPEAPLSTRGSERACMQAGGGEAGSHTARAATTRRTQRPTEAPGRVDASRAGPRSRCASRRWGGRASPVASDLPVRPGTRWGEVAGASRSRQQPHGAPRSRSAAPPPLSAASPSCCPCDLPACAAVAS